MEPGFPYRANVNEENCVFFFAMDEVNEKNKHDEFK